MIRSESDESVCFPILFAIFRIPRGVHCILGLRTTCIREVNICLDTFVYSFNYMFNVSIREYFSVLIVFIVCIVRNTAVFKLIPILCTHVYSYMFSIVRPRV